MQPAPPPIPTGTGAPNGGSRAARGGAEGRGGGRGRAHPPRGAEVGEPFDKLSEDLALIVLGLLTVADFVGDKIPAVDYVLHGAGTVAAPLSGTLLFTGETDASLIVSLLAGGSTAEAVHAARAAERPLSTVTTAGIGNSVLLARGPARRFTLFASLCRCSPCWP